MVNKPLRVCYFGTYRDEYPRNQVMIAGLRAHGIQVYECHEKLWYGIEDRIQAASGGWVRPGFLWRVIKVYLRLLRKYSENNDYDVMIVGYPGQFDVYLAWLLAKIKRKPLCWDILMSIYLVSIERKLREQSSFTISLIKLIEKIACRLPDLLILESKEYIDWFQNTHHVKPEKFCKVPLGVDDTKHRPFQSNPESIEPFVVIYYGNFLASHGVNVILEAARILQKNHSIQFELIGIGPELNKAKSYASEWELSNISFLGWLADDMFFQHIEKANLCLGVFGSTTQSFMTIQHKIVESLAMRKPLITGESPLIQRTFAHKNHLYICKRTGDSLAQGILELSSDPGLCKIMSEAGYEFFTENFSVESIGAKFANCLKELSRSGHRA